MDFYGKKDFYIFLLVISIQLNFAVCFVSKATVESVVPSGENKNIKNVFGSVAKVSKLLSIKKSNFTQSHSEIDPLILPLIGNSPNHLNTSKYVTDDVTTKSPTLSEKIIQKRHGQPIYNRSNNPLISSESWKDLNTIFTDAEMKGFLSSLPIHTLRNLTTTTRKDPEVGQKQLVRLILDRSGYLKEKLERAQNITVNSIPDDIVNDEDSKPKKKISIRKISGHKTNPVFEADENENYSELSHIRPSDSFQLSSTTTDLPVLETPPGAQHSTPSTATERTKRVLPLPSLESTLNTLESEMVTEKLKPEPPTQRQLNSFNSGYYIPSLTSLSPSQPQNSQAQSNGNSDQSQFSWNYQPQDPENTFHPNVDQFMRPPVPESGTEIESNKENHSNSHHTPSSAVWVMPPSDTNMGNKDHPFSGFNSEIKLQHAASGDHIGIDHVYKQQEGGGYEYSSPPGELPNYHYTHSTIHHGPPPLIIQGHHPGQHVQLTEKPRQNEDPHTDNDNEINNNQKYKIQNHYHQESSPSKSRPPSSNQEESPGTYYGNAGHGWGYHDEYDMWSKAKAYFSKGHKTTAAKVFEVSLAVLSFLAFGGYLLMLIYQVFAVSSAVPLFPLLSSTVPQNPTILGVLLGRSSDSNFVYPGEKVEEKYINELESIVKQAMDRVKITLSSKDGSSIRDVDQAKGDMGH